MTTNQKLREDMKHCVEAFDRAAAERDMLQEQLAKADKEAKVCAVVSFSAITALTIFIIVSDLVG
jgi:uncharacterized coiled-coil DUF342 family protein